MIYDVQFISQFKKDLKLAKKQNIKIMNLLAIIRVLVNVISNRIGCSFMKFGIM